MTDHDFDYWELTPDGPEPCGVRECDATENDGEFLACIACGSRVCDDCRRVIGDEIHCTRCGVCVTCGQPATMGCKECGTIVCDVHATGDETCYPCQTEPARVAVGAR